MRRKTIFSMIFLTIWITGFAQVSYLGQEDLLNRVDSCLQHTYNFSFIRARQFQQELARLTPGHPAPVFLEAIIVYWENFPLTPDDAESEKFIELMIRTVNMAQTYIAIDFTHLEGVFFDLFGRAFMAMYWADNGKPMKVVPDLRTMYRYALEGFELKEEFNEFYFSTGLYNYYIEAFPEAHPVYKPLVSFMQEGDKNKGLMQLNHAINQSIFLKVESMLFMSLIQLNYEKDLNSAAIYAERLYREYPRNVYYQGHLITILLYQQRYQQVLRIIGSMQAQADPYSAMIRLFAEAFLAEKLSGDMKLAEHKYWKTIEKAEAFGPFADLFKAMAYMGLSRLYDKKGLISEAKNYARRASKLTVYSFILDE